MVTTIGRVVWPGPVGIGAGIVKGAEAFKDYATKADSVEVGSITKQMRLGNNGQTVWKYGNEHALRHNAGLPNPGALRFAELFAKVQYEVSIPWGLNIAVSPGIRDPQVAADDIEDTVVALLDGRLAPSWITFNVSSPDTEDTIHMLSEPGRVRACLQKIKEVSALSNIPVWLKIGSNIEAEVQKALGEIAVTSGVDALVIGNALPDVHGQPGGWCGEPVRAYMLSSVWAMKQIVGDNVPIVAVGGIYNGTQVKEALQAGARAVQVVSATLFRGRNAAQEIKREYEIIAAKDVEQNMEFI